MKRLISRIVLGTALLVLLGIGVYLGTTILNRSRAKITMIGHEIWVASDVDGKLYVIPLEYGESSSVFFEDTDAVIIGNGQEIDGETEGAFKLGGGDVDVENGEESSLEISRDGEYVAYYVGGHAGYTDSEEAARQGWVVPKDKAAVEAARRDKEDLRQRSLDKAKEEKKREKEAKRQSSPQKGKKREG